MFVAHYEDGKTITEKEMLWDNIPEGITNLQMTLNVRRFVKGENGEMIPAPSPTVTLGKYDAYFYEHEAVAAMMSNNGLVVQPNGVEVARRIGGIDYEKNLVVEIRADRNAFVTISRYPYDKMQRSANSIKKGL